MVNTAFALVLWTAVLLCGTTMVSNEIIGSHQIDEGTNSLQLVQNVDDSNEDSIIIRKKRQTTSGMPNCILPIFTRSVLRNCCSSVPTFFKRNVLRACLAKNELDKFKNLFQFLGLNKTSTGPICYLECIFRRQGLIDTSTNFTNVPLLVTNFTAAVNPTWLPILTTAIATCTAPALSSATAPNSTCLAQPFAYMMCIRKQLELNCPTPSQSTLCTKVFNDMRACV